jgi:O-antigen/teichoic acid export membrane protein
MTAKLRNVYSIANYFWFAASAAFMLVTPLAVTVVLNRAGALEQVGLYAFAYAVTAPVHAFLGLHARTFLAMDRLYGCDAVDFATQRLHMAIGLFLGAGAVAALRGFDALEIKVLAAMCLIRTAEGCAEVTAGLMQYRHRPELIALVYGARAIAATGIFAWLFLTGAGLAISLTAMAGMSFAVFVILDRTLLKRLGAPLPWSEMIDSAFSRRPFQLIWNLAPAGFLLFVSVAETNLSRYVVENMVGLVELGIFTTMSFVLYAATNLIHPVYHMTVTSLGRCVARADAGAAREATRIVVVNLALSVSGCVVVLVAVWIVGMPAMVWAFGPHLADHGPLLTAISIGAAVGVVRSCLGFALTGLNVIRAQTAMIIGNMALFTILVFSGAVGDGVVGIAWAWAIASGVMTCVRLVIAVDRLRRLHGRVSPAHQYQVG